ncbi:MAG: LapA family protein [Firmicutes bacterium]|nr:LapA family protein [Bacillota bacterium]
MQIGFILSLIFAILIAAFALKNGDNVNIDLFFTTREVSQAIVILISTAFGAIMVMILGLVRQIKLSLKIKEQSKKIDTLEEEKQELETQLNTEIEETLLEEEINNDVELEPVEDEIQPEANNNIEGKEKDEIDKMIENEMEEVTQEENEEKKTCEKNE